MSQHQATLVPPGLTGTNKYLSSPIASKPTFDSTGSGTLQSTEADGAMMDGKTSLAPMNGVPEVSAETTLAPADEVNTPVSTPAETTAVTQKPKAKKTVIARDIKPVKKPKKHFKKHVPSSSDGSSSSSSSSESEDSTSSSDETSKRTRRRKGRTTKRMKGKKGTTKADDLDSDSSDDSGSSEDEDARKAVKAKKARVLKRLRARIRALQTQDDSDASSDSESSGTEKAKKQRLKKKRKAKKAKKEALQDSPSADACYDSTQNPLQRRSLSRRSTGLEIVPKPSSTQLKKEARAAKKAEAKRKKLKGTKLEFVRVDRLWDYDKHAYITRETRADVESGEYDEYVFNVRRIFNWDNKHISTVVDIKSKPLKAALIKVMGIVKGISLAEDTPSIDPNMIFLYLEELRTYMNELKAKVKVMGRRKTAKELTVKRKAIKILVKYLDKDYDETKKTLYPMLESRVITFDLLWALYKSNEIVYAPTYTTEEVPRAFKVEYANLVSGTLAARFTE